MEEEKLVRLTIRNVRSTLIRAIRLRADRHGLTQEREALETLSLEYHPEELEIIEMDERIRNMR
jgi:plasmid stability protein